MSRLGSKLSRRIMAAALSAVMIMSSMPVYATQVSDDPVPAEENAVDESMEIVEEAAEAVENVDELTNTEVESAVALYSVGAAEINEDGGEIETYSGTDNGDGSKTYTFYNNVDPSTYADVFTYDGFTAATFEGVQAKKENATITLTLSALSDITVIGCCSLYGGTEVDLTAKSAGDVPLTVVKDYVGKRGAAATWPINSSDITPKFTVLGAENGAVLSVDMNNAIIHSITIKERAASTNYYGIITNVTGNGAVTVSTVKNASYAEKDEIVTLNVIPDNGFSLDTLSIKTASGSDVEDVTQDETDKTQYTFAMPETDVVVSATFEAAGAISAITAGTCSNGSVTVTENLEKAEGEEVVVTDVATVTTDDTYHFQAWKVTDASNETVTVTRNQSTGGKYVFTMPDSAVTISAEFEKDSTELRKEWVFYGSGVVDFNDNSIWGMDNNKNNGNDGYNITVAENGTPVIAAGLKIIKGQFKTATRISQGGYAQVNSDTVIEVPVAGPCKVTVETYQNAGCTIDGTDTTTAPVNCEGTDDKVTITNIKTNYLVSIKVEPVTVTTYTITVAVAADVDHVSAIEPADTSIETATAGKTVKISELVKSVTLDDAENYKLAGWKVTYKVTENGEEVEKDDVEVTKGEDGDYSFTMPAANVTVTPVVVAKGQTYTITPAETVAHATITPVTDGKVENASEGDTVNLKQVATVAITSGEEDDYEHTGWNITYKDSNNEDKTIKATKGTNGEYTFRMPAADVTVTPIISQKYTISLPTGTVANATVTAAANAITKAAEGTVVELDKVATVTVTNNAYEHTGWKVTYTLSGVDKEDVLVKGADGKYTFEMPAANVTVTPVITEKVVSVDYPTWDFSSADFIDGTYDYPLAEEKVYNGLKISAGAGEHETKYLYASNGNSVSIPVSGPCTIKVTTYYAQSYYFESAVTATNPTRTEEYFDYEGEAGVDAYVVIKATGTTYFTKIELSAPVDKYAVTLDKNVTNATVNDAANVPSAIAAGRTVKLSALAEITNLTQGYVVGGWEVKQTDNQEPVAVTYANDVDGFVFTMPSAAVTVKPIIEADAQDRTVKVELKAGNEPLTADDLEGTVILFENADKKQTLTVGAEGTDLNAITLKDGTYKITVYNSKLAVVGPENFTVSADSLTCTINFDKNPKFWDFTTTLFQTYYTGWDLKWYNGLELKDVSTNSPYAKLKNGSEIKIPVSGECDVTVTYYGGSGWLDAKVGDEPYVDAGGSDTSTTYHYSGEEPGTVSITATGQASVRTITVVPAVPAPVFDPKDDDATKSEYTFDTKNGEVRITSRDSGATVKYVVSTDYDTPEAFAAVTAGNILDQGDKLKEAQPVIITANDTTIKAIAVNGTETSKLVTYTYNITATGGDFVALPTAEPDGGTVALGQVVTLTATEGAEIYYTLNNTEPSTETQHYDKDSKITLNSEGEKIIKAIAVTAGGTSKVATFTYNVVKASKLNGVTISGRTNPGATLTAKPEITGTKGSNTTTVYEWYKVKEDADGNVTSEEKLLESGDSFKIPEDGYLGFKIHVKVIFTNEFGVVESAEKTSAVISESNLSGNGIEIEFDEGSTYIYTGAKITPSITVYNNGTPLVEGTDYTVKYTNNVNASEKVNADGTLSAITDNDKKWPTVTVIGKGALSKKKSANFKIVPKDLNNDDYESAVNYATVAEVSAGASAVENKKATLVMLYGGVKLAVKKNFTYDDTTPQNKSDWDGVAKLKLNGVNNFKGSTEITVSVIAQADLAKTKIKKAEFKNGDTIGKDAVKNLYYNGTAHKIDFEVSTKGGLTNAADATDPLLENTDYVISYPEDLTNVGTKKVTITGISSRCTGSVTKTYKVIPADKNGGEFVAENVNPAGYDYVSTGVTFKLTGNDEDVVTFKYVPKTSDNENGRAISTYGEELVPGKDFKISYSNNKKVGDAAKYTVTGLGNYKGIVLKDTFTIKGISLTNENKNIKVTVADVFYNRKGAYKSVPYVTVNVDGQDVLLKSSEYVAWYTVEGDNEEPVKNKTRKIEDENFGDGNSLTVTVTIEKKGKNVVEPGSAETALTETFSIIKKTDGYDKNKDLSKAKIIFFDGETKNKVGYTGKEVYPTSMTVNGDTVALDATTGQPSDATKKFKIVYANNVAKGKATAVVMADEGSDYVGGKAVTFNIVPKVLDNLPDGEGFITSFMKGLLGK